jgi:hypothetical protein
MAWVALILPLIALAVAVVAVQKPSLLPTPVVEAIGRYLPLSSGAQTAAPPIGTARPQASSTAIAGRVVPFTAPSGPVPTPASANPPVSVLSQNVRRVDNLVHIMGEVRNDSGVTAFWQLTATLHAADGAAVATALFEGNRTFGRPETITWRWPAPPMAPGEVQPYWLTIANAPPFSDAKVTGKGFTYTNVYSALPYLPPKLPHDLSASPQNGRLTVRGNVTNNTTAPIEAHVLVWFLNRDGQVIEAHDQRLLQPAPLHPNITAPVQEVASSDAVEARWIVWGTPPPPPR